MVAEKFTPKKPLGALVLHGFTSNFNCVDGVLPRLAKYDLPYRMPALRGHQTQAADLRGVVWQDWLDDGERALKDLLQEVEQVVVVALSMGSLVGIELSIKYPQQVAGLVCIAPALKAYGPNSRVAAVLAMVLKNYKFKPAADQWCEPKLYWERNKNYMTVPTKAIVEFLRFTEHVRPDQKLRQVSVPLLVIETKRDKVVYASELQRLYDTVSSAAKQLKWFEKSGHEMLLDCEAEQVLDEIETFIAEQVRLKEQATTK